MADRGSGSVVITAGQEAVLEVIGDLARYPEWNAELKRVEVLEQDPQGRPLRAQLSLDAGILRDVYELAYDWGTPGAVSWHLTRGQIQKAQEGTYTLTDNGDGTTSVLYQLSVELTIPMPGIVKRKAERRIIDTALKDLKKRVESLSGL